MTNHMYMYRLIILSRVEIITVHDELNVPTLIVKRAHGRINMGRGRGLNPTGKQKRQ